MDITSKDGLLQLHASWIYEWSEIEKITSKKDEASVKSFLSRRDDLFRAPYAGGVDRHLRSGVVVGTTNVPEFLSDTSGDRRFWVLTVGDRIDIETLTSWVPQLWAQALALHLAVRPDGTTENHWLDGAEEELRAEANRAYHTSDPWESFIATWLADPKGGLAKTFVTTADVLMGAIGMRRADVGKAEQSRVGIVMRSLRWTPKRPNTGDRERGYVRPGMDGPSNGTDGANRSQPMDNPTPSNPSSQNEGGDTSNHTAGGTHAKRSNPSRIDTHSNGLDGLDGTGNAVRKPSNGHSPSNVRPTRDAVDDLFDSMGPNEKTGWL
jgi:predicted P-loop ATPase